MSSRPCGVEVEGNATKKRKLMMMMSKDEDDEDAKAEKFFALLKNVHDLRGSSLPAEGRPERDRKKKIDDQIRPVPIWRLSFKPEDFVREALCARGPANKDGASATRNGEDWSGKHGVCIDLNLSL